MGRRISARPLFLGSFFMYMLKAVLAGLFLLVGTLPSSGDMMPGGDFVGTFTNTPMKTKGIKASSKFFDS